MLRANHHLEPRGGGASVDDSVIFRYACLKNSCQPVTDIAERVLELNHCLSAYLPFRQRAKRISQSNDTNIKN